MSFVEHLSAGIEQLKAANDSAVLYDGNDYGAVVGISPPSKKTQSLVGEAAAYVLGPALGAINYVVGSKPFKREAASAPVNPAISVEIEPSEQKGGFKMTTEKVTVTTTTAPKGREKKKYAPPIPRTNYNPITQRGMGKRATYGTYRHYEKGPPNFQTFVNRNNKALKAGRGWKTLPKNRVKSFRDNQGVVSGASAYSARPPGNEVWFSSVPNKPGCLRIRCKIYLATLKMDTTGATVFKPGAGGLNDTAGQWYFSIVMYQMMNSGVVPRMAQYFDSWYQNGSVMEFDTLLNTTGTPFSVTWCFCDSPDHWERLGLSNATTTPSKDQITYMSNSQTFGAWLPKQFIGLPPDRRKYQTAVPLDPATDSFDYFDGMANFRQTVAGTMGIRVDGATPAAVTNIGDVFLHLDVTLCDMSGLQVAAPVFKRARQEKKLLDRSIASMISSQLEDLNLKPRTEKKSSSVKSSRRGDTNSIGSDFEDLDLRKRVVSEPYVQRKFDSTLGYPGEGPPKIDPDRKEKHVPVTDIKTWKDFSSQWTFPHHSGKQVEEGDMICVDGNEFYTELIDLTQDPDLQPSDRKDILSVMCKIVETANADFYMYPDDWDYIKKNLSLRQSEWVLVAHNVLNFCAGLIEVLEYYDNPSDCLSVYNDLKQYHKGRQLFSSYSHCIVKNCQYHGRLHQSNEPTKCKLFLAQQAASEVNSSS